MGYGICLLLLGALLFTLVLGDPNTQLHRIVCARGSTGKVSGDSSSHFGDNLKQVLDGLVEQAALHSTTSGDLESGYGRGRDRAYGKASCSSRLNEKDCVSCIKKIVQDIEQSCGDGSSGAHVKLEDCDLRYGNKKFYEKNRRRNSGSAIWRTLVGASVGVSVITIIGLMVFLSWFRRKKQMIPSRQADQHQIPCYTYSDLQLATENFSSDKKLEDGQFGEVYKGELSDGTKLAVKKLLPRYHQQEDVFVSEVSMILAAEHPNLVKLKGCCMEADNHFLLYEYLEHNPLSQLLFNPKDDECLNWQTRLSIATGVARGLAYLHEKAHVIHGDIRASNILIDENFIPKISDFGLTKLLPDEDSHVNARFSGTFGYMAPEYAIQCQLTEKADVFSFGVVMLELISGRSHMELSLPMEKVFLLEWTWKLYEQGKVLELVDPRLRGDYPSEEVFRAIHIALLCTQASAKSRPSMVQAGAMLTQDWEISVFPSKPGSLSELQV